MSQGDAPKTMILKNLAPETKSSLTVEEGCKAENVEIRETDAQANESTLTEKPTVA